MLTRKTALIIAADGMNEMQFVIPVAILRRANVEVTIAGCHGMRLVTGAGETKIMPDEDIEESIKKVYDVVILPGGIKNSEEYCRNSAIGALLREQEGASKLIAAICTAPIALKAHQIYLGKKLTCNPNVYRSVIKGNLYEYMSERVVVDGNLITSRGTGNSFDFALAIAEELTGRNASNTVKRYFLL